MIADAVSLRAIMDAIAARTLAGEAFCRLSAVVMIPVPSALVRTSASPGADADVANHAIGMHDAGNRPSRT